VNKTLLQITLLDSRFINECTGCYSTYDM